jgi:hypothetical protein
MITILTNDPSFLCHLAPSEDIFAFHLLSLSIVSDWIKIWWNRLNEEEQISLRVTITNKIFYHFISSLSTSSSTTTSPLIRSIERKIAEIISQLIERQFPQNWPTMLPDIFDLLLQSPSGPSSALLLISLHQVASDCVDNDFENLLPTIRRQEIILAFKENQEMMLTALFLIAQRAIETYSNFFRKIFFVYSNFIQNFFQIFFQFFFLSFLLLL